jgi:GNAT superfamily N-acetyltransferase
MTPIRRCRDDEHPTILGIVNAAAARYRGVIPDDCLHDPYMTAEQLARAIGAGVDFHGFENTSGNLTGVMGLQRVRDVTLVRHAYVLPTSQGEGIGGQLLQHLEQTTDQRILIGTWAAAVWAIRFYERHGYAVVPEVDTPALLRTYWDISPRQVETSVVLAKAAAPRR